jgi:hypothetical protein
MLRLFALAVIVAAFSLKSRPEIVTNSGRGEIATVATVADSEPGVSPIHWVPASPRQDNRRPNPGEFPAVTRPAEESRGRVTSQARTRDQGSR